MTPGAPGIPPVLREMPPAVFATVSSSRQTTTAPPSLSLQQQEQQFARQLHQFAQRHNVTSRAILQPQATATQVSSLATATSRQVQRSPGKRSVDATMTSHAPYLLLPSDAAPIMANNNNNIIVQEKKQQQQPQQRQVLMNPNVNNIQTGYNSSAARRCAESEYDYWKDISDIITVQSLVRRRAAQTLLEAKRHQFFLDFASATKLQTWYKASCARKRYQRDLFHIRMIQRFVRCCYQKTARRMSREEKQRESMERRRSANHQDEIKGNAMLEATTLDIAGPTRIVEENLSETQKSSSKEGRNVSGQEETEDDIMKRSKNVFDQEERKEDAMEAATGLTSTTRDLYETSSHEAKKVSREDETAPAITEDRYTTQEPSLEAKKVSGQDESQDDNVKKSALDNSTGDNEGGVYCIAQDTEAPRKKEATQSSVTAQVPVWQGGSEGENTGRWTAEFFSSVFDEIQDDDVKNGLVYCIPRDTEAPREKDATQSCVTAQDPVWRGDGENAGRWTTGEHRLFLLGLDRYGNDGKNIAKVVKTRTVLQIRNHAQNYFRNLEKETAPAANNPTDNAADEKANANLVEFHRDKWIKRMIADVDNDKSTPPPRIKLGPVVATCTQDLHTAQEIAPQAEKESSQYASQGHVVKATPNSTVRKERYSLNGVTDSNTALDDAEPTPPRKPHQHHQHRHLNEDTLKMLKSHLQSDPGEYLDEDAVAARILKTERVKLTQLCDDSQGEDDDAARRQAYQNTEDNAFAFDFYKKTVNATRKENPGSVLDKKTLDWLRRAMGLHRDTFVETTDGSHAGQSNAVAGAEDTCQGVPRSSRIRKRKERETRETLDLGALIWGATKAEEELKARRERKASKFKKRKSRGGAVKPPDENPKKRQRSLGRDLRPVNTSNPKSEKRQKSMVKPTLTREDTDDTPKKSHVRSSWVNPRFNIVPPAPPLPMAPFLSNRGRNKRELHGLATLAQRFRYVVTASGSQDIDLQAVVDKLGIPKRRIYDVVNILDGAGFIESTKERNHYRWLPKVDFSDVLQLEKEVRQLEKEARKLDEWIGHRSASVEVLKQKYIDGITRANKRARVMTTEKKRQEDAAAVKKARHVTPPPVKPSPNPVTPATTESAMTALTTMASVTMLPTPAVTRPPVLSKFARKLHCLATLSQRFQEVVTTSGSYDIDLADVVRQLHIPKRRIYDVVNVLLGAGVIERLSSNNYRWISRVIISPEDLKKLEEEENQLREEESRLDEWIRLVADCNCEMWETRSISLIKNIASSTNESS